MISKIRNKVDELFEEAPQTKKAFELKEELIVNLTEKYNDLASLGKPPEEAYNNVIASIGDVDELIRGLKQNDVLSVEREEKERKKTAMVVAGSVGLYILSVISLITLVAVVGVDGVIAVMVFLVIAGASTCMLIYHFMSKPNYIKADETLVEEFKAWKQGHAQKNQLCKSLISIMWTLITAIYLIISFTLHIWAYSWIIFIIGAVIEQIIKLVFDMRNTRE
ncbi:permease prefix domain 1-containing protein [Cellulosilyticum sp. I15G10I2]|uniref:permease prefix domain 1-containing protein n=1 Tax=Cellulosilyticum sp. I15G10I2 TaxID=1892843 RepID=UPI00085C9DD5|nr:permease prefix domain 1-containing protein [Cellulosilyticum sp. I15G10I2]